MCLGKRLVPQEHAPPRSLSPRAFKVRRACPVPVTPTACILISPGAVSYPPLELRGAAHARLAAAGLAIPFRARLSVGRSVGGPGRPEACVAGKRPVPTSPGTEPPDFPRFEAELGEMRENDPRQPPAERVFGPAWGAFLINHHSSTSPLHGVAFRVDAATAVSSLLAKVQGNSACPTLW
jgi:hypothetical protein